MNDKIMLILNDIISTPIPMKLSNCDGMNCQENDVCKSRCMKCSGCMAVLLSVICESLLGHLTHNKAISFIESCFEIEEMDNLLRDVFKPLLSKDRIYSQCNVNPALSTDVYDIGLKNFAVDASNIERITMFTKTWIREQPSEFKSQFLFSVLSKIKISVLAELHKKIVNSRLTKLNRSRNPNDAEDCGKIDFVTRLPVQISKRILKLLDESTLKICGNVNQYWKKIVQQVRREDIVHQKIKEQAMLLQSQKDGSNLAVSSIPTEPNFARDVDVRVPQLYKNSSSVVYKESVNRSEMIAKSKAMFSHSVTEQQSESSLNILSRKQYNMDSAYRNVATKNVIMEERNIFCGAYSVLLVVDGAPRGGKGVQRTICYHGGDLIGVSSGKSIHLYDVEGKINPLTKTKILGHAGSIMTLKLIRNVDLASDRNKEAQILSGGFDTTIRRWDVKTGKCLKIYMGHMGTITCFAVAEEIFVSGAEDKTCRIWNYEDRKCLYTLQHKFPVTAVALSQQLCVTGDSSGMIKVWNLSNGKFIKKLTGHNQEVRALAVDNYHIVSASLDCFALLWSAAGQFPACIGSFRHPKPVYCMSFLYLRAVTGCEDGRIRIWNVLNGACIRLIRGNSRSDPILDLIISGDRILVNTISNVVVMNFEPVCWKYFNDDHVKTYASTVKNLKVKVVKDTSNTINEENLNIERSQSGNHLRQRQNRARYAGHIDPRIFLQPVLFRSNTAHNLVSSDSPNFMSRSNTWLVTPSLHKRPLSAKLMTYQSQSQSAANVAEEKFQDAASETEIKAEPNQSLFKSYNGRRLSYGFETSHTITDNELVCTELAGNEPRELLGNGQTLDEVKKILRTNIRSQPEQAAEAMPNFVKVLSSQMKESGGRPFSTGGKSRLERPSSGPSKVNTKLTVSVKDIRDALSPTVVSSLPTDVKEEKQLKQEVSDTNSSNNKKLTVSSNIGNDEKSEHIITQAKFTTSFKTINLKCPIAKVPIPMDYREKLIKQRNEVVKKHQLSAATIHSESASKSAHKTIIGKHSPTKSAATTLTVNDLKLKTYQDSKAYMEEIERKTREYFDHNVETERNQKYTEWLQRAKKSGDIKYEKDVLMRRPRSAKM